MSWSKDSSLVLSQASTRIVMALGALLAVALPFLCMGDFFIGRAFIATENILYLMPVYYAFCIPAYTALFALDRLLAAVKRSEVFTAQNVRYLRIISWACIAAAIVLLISSFISITFFALAILATFFGIILRVVKNLFAAAVVLKTENELTI
ncbi:MAG TPA: DUF2975 domain-containing protein [Coriobacteriia bacterium]|nr:DUF2975 domain-containing protein [Coriobacteriia bacterium]